MFKRIPVFWRFQLVGWLVYFCIQLVMNYTMARSFVNLSFIISSAAELIVCIIITTLLYIVIKKIQIAEKGVVPQLLFILLSSIVFALPLSIINLKLRIEITKFDNGFTMLAGWISFFLLVLAWNITYFFSHHVIKNNEAKINKLQLESLVKELELKTIKAHINPHFIFNALNSIRSLANESSERTREAIMQLSILLRSSMQADNISTTPLKSELKIINSYLQLEKLRFEDRLNVVYDIDEAALQAPVPPMLLQTLVENAIKHGLSRYENKGQIQIAAHINDDNLIVKISNNGHLANDTEPTGFGLKSVTTRLRLLYGDTASFSLYSKQKDIVEAQVIIPLQETFVNNFHVLKT